MIPAESRRFRQHPAFSLDRGTLRVTSNLAPAGQHQPDVFIVLSGDLSRHDAIRLLEEACERIVAAIELRQIERRA